MVALRQANPFHYQQIARLRGKVRINERTAAAGQGIDREGLEGAVVCRGEGQTPTVEVHRVHGFHTFSMTLTVPPARQPAHWPVRRDKG